MTFRNKNFTKRNYECTNVVACTVVDEGSKVPENYEPCSDAILNNLTPLWIQSGIRYWGWL